MALHDALTERNFSWTLSIRSAAASATVVTENAVTYEITTRSEVMSLLWVYLESLSPTPCGLEA